MRDFQTTSGAKPGIVPILAIALALLLSALGPSAHAVTEGDTSNRQDDTSLRHSEAYLDTWRWTRFGSTDGLPDSPILSIQEHEDGILALTHDDVLLYDGWKWRPLSPPVEYVLDLCVDANGRLWVASHNGLYQGGTDEAFEKVILPEPFNDGMVTSIIPHPVGGVAFVVRGDEGDWKAFRLDQELTEPSDLQKAEFSQPPHLYSTRARPLISAGSGLYSYKNGLQLLLESDAGDLKPRCADMNASGDGLIAFRAPRSVMGIWEISPELGIRHVTSEGRGVVRCAAVSEDGEAIVVYESGDVRLRENGQWRSLYPVPTSIRSATSVTYTAGGDLWVGSVGEMHVFMQSNNYWSQHRDSAVNSPWNQVHDLISTRDGRVFAATSGGLLSVGPRHRVGSRTTRELNHLPVPPVANGELLTSVRQAADGRIWTCSPDGFEGAAVWDGTKWEVVSVDADGQPLPRFLRVQVDANDGIWLMNHQPTKEQPSVYRLTDDGIRPFEDVDELGGRPGSALLDDDRGRLWIATRDGISRRDVDGMWKHWDLADNWSGYFRFVKQGPDGRVWFGARGLHVGWIGDNDEITIDEDGPYEARDVAFGEDGAVWCVSLAGIFLHRSEGWQYFDSEPLTTATQLGRLLLLRDSILVGSRSSGLYEISSGIHVIPPPRVEVQTPVVDSGRLHVDWDVYAWWGTKPASEVHTRTSINGEEWSKWSTARQLVVTDPPAGENELRVQSRSPSGELQTTRVDFRVKKPTYTHPAVAGTMIGLLLTVGWLGFGIVRQRARGRKALATSEQLFRGIAEQAREIVWLGEADSDRLAYVNPAGVDIWRNYAATRGALRSRSQWREQVEPEDREVVERHHASVAAGVPGVLEYRMRRHGEDVHWVRERSFPLRNANGRLSMIAALIEDVTDRRQEEEVRRHEEEKQRSAIVQEVHHRVKNTLQGVVGLLENQIHEKPESRDALESSILQINAVATVHGLESKSGRVRVAELVRTIAHHVRTTLQCEVAVRDHIQEADLALASGEGVPIALVLNEVVFNAARHRVPGSSGIDVHLSRTGEAVVIQIRNEGRLPDGFDLETGSTTGTGLSLVRLLIPRDKVWLQIDQVGEDVYSRLSISSELIFGADATTNAARDTDAEGRARAELEGLGDRG